MDVEKIKADFQIESSAIKNVILKVKHMPDKGEKITYHLDVDYNILNLEESDSAYHGALELFIEIKAKSGRKNILEIKLESEAHFKGNKKTITYDQFRDMLELNGLATLSHLSRSYILAFTALSGINPPVRMPLLNIHALREMKNIEKH